MGPRRSSRSSVHRDSAGRRAQTITDGLIGLLNTQTLQPGDVVKDQEAALITTQTVARALSIELATIPVTSSAGGFVYRFNRSLAVVERASDSFGPFFAERALRPGRHQTSIGWTLRYAEYTKLDGYDLDEGTFITAANVREGERRPFSVDRLSLRMTTRQITGFGNYGITDRIDVGIAVPVVTLRVQGQRTNAVNGAIPVVQTSVSERDDRPRRHRAARARASVRRTAARDWASAPIVRLPTGREEDLLGAGKTALKMFAIGSLEGGRFAAHVNAGGTVGGLGRELNYNGAATLAVAQHVTLVGEVLGRRVTNLARVAPVYEPHPLVAEREHDAMGAGGNGDAHGAAARGLQGERRAGLAAEREHHVPADERRLERPRRSWRRAGLFIRDAKSEGHAHEVPIVRRTTEFLAELAALDEVLRSPAEPARPPITPIDPGFDQRRDLVRPPPDAVALHASSGRVAACRCGRRGDSSFPRSSFARHAVAVLCGGFLAGGYLGWSPDHERWSTPIRSRSARGAPVNDDGRLQRCDGARRTDRRCVARAEGRCIDSAARLDTTSARTPRRDHAVAAPRAASVRRACCADVARRRAPAPPFVAAGRRCRSTPRRASLRRRSRRPHRLPRDRVRRRLTSAPLPNAPVPATAADAAERQRPRRQSDGRRGR